MLFRKSFIGLLLMGGLLVGLSGMILAQSTLGTLLGTVKDTSGAVVPGATVVITAVDTDISRTVVTNASGNYVLVDAKAGHYSVRVTKSGFQTSTITGLTLLARQALRANVTLHIGKVAQSVTVNGKAIGVITTDTSTVSSNYQHLMITNLPTNYRASSSGNSPYYLLTLLPGAESDQSGTLSVQGGNVTQLSTTVDGINTVDDTGNSPLRNAFPSTEGVSEMRVQGVGAPAEYGDPADITTVSKSGTNKPHGSLFWYNQMSALNAIPYGTISKGKLVTNDFGGSLGGPVVIPHIYNGRNKTFFFADMELYRSPRTGVIQDTVPTQAMRNGDLSSFCTAGFNANGICNDPSGQITNPYTGQPFANNQIPSTMISSVTQKILKLYPDPNFGSAFTYHNYRANVPASLHSNSFDFRGDEDFNSKLSVFGRYSMKNISQGSPAELLIPSYQNFDHIKMLVAAATYVLSPTKLNEFRFGITDYPSGYSNPFDGKAFSDGLGLQGLAPAFWNGVTNVSFSGLTSNLNVNRIEGTRLSKTTEATDNFTWVKGPHTFKFGVDWRKVRGASPLGFFGADNYGSFSFNGFFTGNDFGDFLLGIPFQSELDNVTTDNNGWTNFYDWYAQDSYQVNSRLTLDYGIRWEYHPGYQDIGKDIGTFNEHIPRSGATIYPDGGAALLSPGYMISGDTCPNPALPYTANDPSQINGAPCTPALSASQAGIPQGLRATSKRFMPRFGFAFKPFNNDKTVIRGSIGGYEAVSLGSIYYSVTATLQAFTKTYLNSLTANGPVFAWPQTSTSASGFSTTPDYGTNYFGTANEINWKEPYATQWSLSVERDLGFNTGLRVSYIGMKTTNLVWAVNWNQSLPSTTPYAAQPLSRRPFPNWGVVNSRTPGATAWYNALEIEANHKLSSGLTFDSTFLYDRDLTDDQGPHGGNGGVCGEDACSRAGTLYNRRLEYGNAYNPRFRWLTTFVYQLPFGRGQRFLKTSNPIANGFLGGWQMSNILEFQSGPFLTPYISGIDPSGSGIGITGGRDSMPDKIGTAHPANQNSGEWFAASGYQCPGGGSLANCQTGLSAAHPPIGRFGTASVGSLQGPGTIDWDLGISKSFHLTEHARLRIEASFVNVLNHINWGQPDMKVTDPNNPAQGICGFGCISAAQGLYQFSGAREGQIGARIDF